MKKKNLNRLMIAGISSGILFCSQAYADTEKKDPPSKSLADLFEETNGNITDHLMTEDELLIQLNEEGTRLYNSLTPEGKKLALSVASRSCNGRNECSGLGACANDKHTCAGKNDCNGQTKCAMSDANLAVKLVAKKMEKKRLEAQNK